MEENSKESLANENCWLQRLLNRFKENSRESINSDEWLSSLLDKPIPGSNISQNVRTTATVLDQLLQNSPDPELSALIDDLVDWTEERPESPNRLDGSSKTEEALSSLTPNDATRAIPTILNALLKWENEYVGKTEPNDVGSSPTLTGDNSTLDTDFCWIDSVLRRSQIGQNESTSTDWFHSLLNKPSNIPQDIPKMDFTQTSALRSSENQF